METAPSLPVPPIKPEPPMASLDGGARLAARKMAPMVNISAADRRCLAKTIYFEARGESAEGRMAVAAVVLNRVRHSRFPDTICGVVRQGGENPSRGCQFSWWCDGRSDEPRERHAWAEARRLADEMIAGRHLDRTDGALFYHHHAVAPVWRRHMRQTALIDQHVFYQYE